MPATRSSVSAMGKFARAEIEQAVGHNPNRDAPRVVGSWMQAGGRLASDDILQPNA